VSVNVVSVVSPVCQHASGIELLVKSLKEVFDTIDSEPEIILVDDGSLDNSWQEIKCLEKEYPIIGLKHSRNMGQHQAIYTGLLEASGNMVIVMDCDLQDDPANIPKLIEASINTNASVVAFRVTKNNHPYYVLSSKLLNWLLSKIIGIPIHYKTGNFGCYQKTCVDRIKQIDRKSFYFPVAVRKVEGDVKSIVVQHKERSHGESTYNFGSHVKLAFQAIHFSFRKSNLQSSASVELISEKVKSKLLS